MPGNIPAFPVVINNETIEHNEGMTLRDFFAAFALAGMVADGSNGSPRICARRAYAHADEMLKAREEEKK